jgi:hypothetical protein
MSTIITEPPDYSDLSLANTTYICLLKEIGKFEDTLKVDEEIGYFIFTSFAGGTNICIDSMYPADSYFVVFGGNIHNTNERIKLVQHSTQINVLFVAVKFQPEENRQPKRIIGFIS